MKKIGTIVSYHFKTDTCLFSVHNDINVELNTVRVAPGHLHVFDPHHVEILQKGDTLTMFGAQGRGMMGEVIGRDDVVTCETVKCETCILKNNIVMEVICTDGYQFEHTHDWDCGGLFLTEAGNPATIHLVLKTTPCPTWLEACIEKVVARATGKPYNLKPRKYKSYSAPVALAVQAHFSELNLIQEGRNKNETLPRLSVFLGGDNNTTSISARNTNLAKSRLEVVNSRTIMLLGLESRALSAECFLGAGKEK